MVFRQCSTGLVRHMVTLADSSRGAVRASRMVLGTPRMLAIKAAIYEAIAVPNPGGSISGSIRE